MTNCYRCRLKPLVPGTYACEDCAVLFRAEREAREEAERARQAHWFWKPTKAYSFIDAVNRAAAATGSIEYAAAAGSGDYNGHRITLEWNSFRGYWVGWYRWAGDFRFARTTDLAAALRESLGVFASQGRGATLVVEARTAEEGAACAAAGLVPWSPAIEAAHRATFADWRYDEVHSALDTDRRGGRGGEIASLIATDPTKTTREEWKRARWDAVTARTGR